ncbi:MAG: tRNA adenosine(34) deaminase TadA [Bacillota bacterium]
MVEKKHENFMREALKEAEKAASIEEVPIGAVIVKDDRVIARGHNLRESTQKSTAHAEIVAIEKACEVLGTWRLEGCTLYVTVEPCPMCAGAMIQSRIERVVYGASDNKTGAHVSNINVFSGDFNHKVEVIPHVLAEESRNRLKKFFSALRTKKNHV